MASGRKSVTLLTALLVMLAALLGSYSASGMKAHASHILVDSETLADELHAELKSAKNVFASFAKLAMEHSKCPSSKKGGDLGTFGQGQMVPEFDHVVFTEEIGVVHKVKTQFGWHLVLISTRSDGSEAPESGVYRMFREFLLKASPFIGPVLLVLIMVFGSKFSSKSAGPKARASHILVKTEAEVDALIKEINAAADPKKKLAELAAKKSSCPSGKKGGDLGSFGRGQMVPAFDKVVFEEEVGKVHKVQTQVCLFIYLCFRAIDLDMEY
jgi:parvulin-like peptidyl-prolyl isomerase|uniref:Peptidyl-prolyl cis-trans isomerase n=1 Tax=Globisporangium ultimum (strain ATCC 200006 / CBS 805.95 / DAOM BR144) TaxID=431595 RepID=K3X0K4_GLOUD